MKVNYNPGSLIRTPVSPAKNIAHVNGPMVLVFTIAEYSITKLNSAEKADWGSSKQVRTAEMPDFLPPVGGEDGLQWDTMLIEISVDLIIICLDPETDMQKFRRLRRALVSTDCCGKTNQAFLPYFPWERRVRSMRLEHGGGKINKIVPLLTWLVQYKTRQLNPVSSSFTSISISEKWWLFSLVSSFVTMRYCIFAAKAFHMRFSFGVMKQTTV
jgi:hypothetical protein